MIAAETGPGETTAPKETRNENTKTAARLSEGIARTSRIGFVF
jgi:hypothetical protein